MQGRDRYITNSTNEVDDDQQVAEGHPSQLPKEEAYGPSPHPAAG